MIAYHHYIQFIPELKQAKKAESSYANALTIKKSTDPGLGKMLQFDKGFVQDQPRDIRLFTDRELARTQAGQLWAFEVKEVVTFFWHSGTSMINYIPKDNFTEELLEYWCLHIFLPIFFILEETFDVLHAGAVEVEGRPILFTADCNGGKSTMVDFFLKKGHTMVSDDKIATYEKDGRFFAVPSHPHHRPHKEDEDKGYDVKNYAIEPKQIQAIYRLEDADPSAKIEIVEISGAEKFQLLIYSSEANLSFLKAKRFAYLTRMLNVVKVFSVKVPWDLDKLESVYHEILEHQAREARKYEE